MLKAKVLRDAAAVYRQLPMKRLIHVQEEEDDANEAARAD